MLRTAQSREAYHEADPGLAVPHLASIEKLYAFSYVPSPPLDSDKGWSIYTPREEFTRMGVGSRTKAWRFTDINKDYQVGQAPLLAFLPTILMLPSSVLANVPVQARGARQDQRLVSEPCGQVPEQGAHTGAHLPPLGQFCSDLPLPALSSELLRL